MTEHRMTDVADLEVKTQDQIIPDGTTAATQAQTGSTSAAAIAGGGDHGGPATKT